MNSSETITVATADPTIWNTSRSAPRGIRITLTTAEMPTAGARNTGRVAHAAIGTIAHSRYHGWTTGKSSTMAPSETPSAPTGCSRPVQVATSIRTVMKPATTAAIGRVMLSSAVVWSPSPSSTPPNPVMMPSAVGSDIQLRTALAVFRVFSQPNPSPLTVLITTVTRTAISPSSPAAASICRRPGPQRRASAIPAKPSAMIEVTLTEADRLITTAPPTSSVQPRPSSGGGPPSPGTPWIARSMNSSPASISPSMSASLWTPPMRWNSTSGFATPSHSALTGATPQRMDRRGSAQTINATPARASSRCTQTPARMFSPVISAIPCPIQRNNGPYGAGVSRQMLGTLLVSTLSMPRPATGPSRYGSIPRAAISLCAR